MKRFFAIALLVLSLSACKPISEQIVVRDYSLDKPGNVALGLSQLSLESALLLEADNFSGMNVTLKAFEAELYNKSDKKVADISLATKRGESKPVLHRKSSETVSVPLRVDFDNPLSAITLVAMSLEDFGEKGYTVDYDCTLKAGCLKKRFQGHKVPVETLIKMLER